MGSFIEFNDTLQLTTEQGFPKELKLEKHIKKPFTIKDFESRVFEFDKPNMRLYHPAPIRVFLVHNINGKWLYWGHSHIIEQTIHSDTKTTTGKFKIVKIYDPKYQEQVSRNETKKGCEYFK
ncbi:MAG: hypothetical protein AABX14_01965 [Candidatus Aenigmatarchaeota archaeon]